MIYILVNTILLLYVVLLTIWIFNVLTTKHIVTGDYQNELTVTVIIPARNESSNIDICLASLLKLDCDPARVEFIVADDHSEDDTIKKCGDWIGKFADKNFRFIVSEAEEQESEGKKNALNRAIKIAQGDVIITSDADCTFESGWIHKHIEQYYDSEVNMVCGPVIIAPTKKFLDYFQSIEQSVLTAISIGALHMGYPLMCNGANLSFRKTTFDEIGGYSYGIALPGGDDVFLMLSMNRSYPGSIKYLSSLQSKVTTSAETGFNSYIDQRLRHGSKVKTYEEWHVKLIGGLLLSSNIIVFLSGILFVAQWIPANYLFWIFVAKFGMDAVFGIIALFKFKQYNLLVYILPVTILYPLISTFIGISIIFKKNYTWKGRLFK